MNGRRQKKGTDFERGRHDCTLDATKNIAYPLGMGKKKAISSMPKAGPANPCLVPASQQRDAAKSSR